MLYIYMRQYACLVFNPIMVDHASRSADGPDIDIHFSRLGPELLVWPTGI